MDLYWGLKDAVVSFRPPTPVNILILPYIPSTLSTFFSASTFLSVVSRRWMTSGYFQRATEVELKILKVSGRLCPNSVAKISQGIVF